jgi:hypothetical protein
MANFFKILLLLFTTTGIFNSCGDLNRKAEKKFDDLQRKSESLDSLINKEVDKVLVLDSLITTEFDKVKKLDSLIIKTSSRLDSIVDKVIKPVNK